MNTIKCLSDELEALSPKSTTNETKQLFKRLTFTHIPIVHNQLLLGSIAEKDLSLLDENVLLIPTYLHLLEPFYAEENTSWLDLLKLFSTYDTNILPVLNTEKQYIGYYELAHILHLFYETPFLNQNGAIIIIEKESKNYSFSEISQIIESNDCNLLGMFISDVYNDKVQITLKLAYCNISSVHETFTRYGYQLLTNFHDDETLENMKNRAEYLLKYLKM